MEARFIKNRFPHHIRIYREADVTNFSDGEEEDIYDGECLVYGSSQLRTFRSDNVIKCDYAVDIPKIIRGAGEGGCCADIEDFNGVKTHLEVTSCYAGYYGEREGSTLYLNIVQN